jgi:F-type H+-transporting ATPase subunit a
MELSPDATVIARWGPVSLNATIVYTWLVMLLLVFGSWVVSRNLRTGPESRQRGQTLLEALVALIREQVRDSMGRDPLPYLPFIGTLFLFISVSNLLAIVPGFEPPTGSLSTTAALALCVFVSVPVYGVAARGVAGYLRHYIQPTPVMLPFRIISEFSRTLALAVRLFGNVMSGQLIVAILLSVIPLFVPVLLQGLELMVGQVQAYIFAVLATVYIASAIRTSADADDEAGANQSTDNAEE